MISANELFENVYSFNTHKSKLMEVDDLVSWFLEANKEIEIEVNKFHKLTPITARKELQNRVFREFVEVCQADRNAQQGMKACEKAEDQKRKGGNKNEN